jgi:hypothetical protein
MSVLIEKGATFLGIPLVIVRNVLKAHEIDVLVTTIEGVLMVSYSIGSESDWPSWMHIEL